jgi:hypothetical protein
MLQLPGSGARRLGVAVLLVAAACSAPDPSGLYGPVTSSPIRSEAPAPEPSSDVGAGAPLQPPSRPAVMPSGSSGEGNTPVGGVSSPGSSTGNGSSAPVALEPDAGPPLFEPGAGDAGADPVGPPEPPSPPPPPPPEPELECASVAFQGSCWYVGALGLSCATVCATRGGFSPASLAVVGTPAQGGSIDACDALLQAFGAPAGVVNEGFREDGLGFGCHLFIDAEDTATAWWLTSPALTADVSDPSVRMLCGCVN